MANEGRSHEEQCGRVNDSGAHPTCWPRLHRNPGWPQILLGDVGMNHSRLRNEYRQETFFLTGNNRFQTRRSFWMLMLLRVSSRRVDRSSRTHWLLKWEEALHSHALLTEIPCLGTCYRRLAWTSSRFFSPLPLLGWCVVASRVHYGDGGTDMLRSQNLLWTSHRAPKGASRASYTSRAQLCPTCQLW